MRYSVHSNFNSGVQDVDAIDILGALLGRKANASGSGNKTGAGTKIETGTIGSGRSKPAADPFETQSNARPMTVEESARSLEDLLNVATDHHTSKRTSSKPAPPPSTPAPAPTPTRASLPERAQLPSGLNEQAKLLVRAMIAAAKSDGQLTNDEQDAIVQQLGHAGPAEIEFLRQEFAAPTNVRDLAWSVPLGMEDQVYTISLRAIQLDEQSEASYLGELAHGLRMQPARCNEIHRKYGAPEIFR
jgi:hypothetical protein